MTQQVRAHGRAHSDPLDELPTTGSETCAWPGCRESGEHRAPTDRTLSEYQFFCLEHIRVFNAAWNYNAGLSPEEIEDEIRRSVTWERPTWRIGGECRFQPGRTKVHDPFGFAAGTAFDETARKDAHAARPRSGRTAAEDKALKVLDLTAPLTLESLRYRYKTLVKQHHPDANGGSREAEKRMQVINEAYRTLREALSTAH